MVYMGYVAASFWAALHPRPCSCHLRSILSPPRPLTPKRETPMPNTQQVN